MCDVIKPPISLITDADNELVCFCVHNLRAVRRTEHGLTNKQPPAGEHRAQSTSSTMSSLVALLLVTLVTQSCAAPQRRNWTPQAMLYLKGAQGHRSVLERPSRDEGDSVHLVTHGQSSGGLGLSLASSILLELLQRAVVEGGDYPEEQQLKLNYL